MKWFYELTTALTEEQLQRSGYDSRQQFARKADALKAAKALAKHCPYVMVEKCWYNEALDNNVPLEGAEIVWHYNPYNW